MDLRSDNATGTVGITIDTALSLVKGIQEKAILKKAKKLVNAGQQNKLTGRMIDVMIEAGVDPSAYNTSPVWLARPGNAALAAAKISSTIASGVPTKVAAGVPSNKLLFVIIGLVVVGVLVFLIARKK